MGARRRPGWRRPENGAVTSSVPVHLRVEPAHFDWRWRERPVLALLAWEALARDPLARLRRIQVESIGTTINFRPAATRAAKNGKSQTDHFFAFSPAPDFRETPNLFAIRATFSGVRFISSATASSDFNDAASCIKRGSSAKDQRVLVAILAIAVCRLCLPPGQSLGQPDLELGPPLV